MGEKISSVIPGSSSPLEKGSPEVKLTLFSNHSRNPHFDRRGSYYTIKVSIYILVFWPK